MIISEQSSLHLSFEFTEKLAKDDDFFFYANV